MATKQINLRLDEELLVKIDEMRGLVPRNTWLTNVLERLVAAQGMATRFEDGMARLVAPSGPSGDSARQLSPKLRSGIKARPKGKK